MNPPPPASVHMSLATAHAPGAVAIIQVYGETNALRELLRQLTGQTDWPAGRLRLVDFGGIDQGLAVLFPPPPSAGEGTSAPAQLMPHGGPRVVRKLLDRLRELGATYEAEPPARLVYPEAASDLEADMLACLARAASPAAIDWLLAQPALWGAWLERHEGTETRKHEGESVAAILTRSAMLDRLVTPPTVVVVGRPNVGKSTLSNALLGRAASLVADLPGTTRDWVAGLAELSFEFRVSGFELGHGGAHSDSSSSTPNLKPEARSSKPETRNPKPETRNSAAVAVRWLDTPGLRATADPVEARAIELARRVMMGADVLIALRDPQLDWPDAAALPRRPDLWALNKADPLARAAAPAPNPGRHPATPLPISAHTGLGLDALQQLVLERLELADLREPALWAFSPSLRAALAARHMPDLRRYLGAH